ADLREAKFLCAESKPDAGASARLERNAANPELYCADLKSATLVGAQLHGATFVGAQLQDADLKDADLRNVVLGCKETYWKQDEANEFSDMEFTVRCTQLQRARLDG